MTDNLTLLMPDTFVKNLDVFEVKQLADKEAAYKEMCAHSIACYKRWQKQQQDQTDMIELLYGSMEGNMYRNIAIDSVRLYWAVRKHFRCSFSHYLEKVGHYPSHQSIAQKEMRA